MRHALTLGTVILAAACASGGGGGATKPKGLDTAPFSPSLQIDGTAMKQSPTGLWVQDIEPGAGIPAQTSDFVRVEYSLFLANGTRIEGSEPGKPLEVRLGQHTIIAGWEEGLTGMKNGGRRRIVVPPQLGYGMRTRGAIPGGSTLVFDLHVVYVGR